MAVTFAATQFACSRTPPRPGPRERLVRAPRARRAGGAAAGTVRDAVLLQGPPGPSFDLARPVSGNPVLERFQGLARELGVVLPYSFFERANNAYFNSLAMIDADGALLGVYRKSHIPEGPATTRSTISRPATPAFASGARASACSASASAGTVVPRGRALHGAHGRGCAALSDGDRLGAARREHRLARPLAALHAGHAAANVVPVIASNRIGVERGTVRDDVLRVLVHRGPHGAKVAEADRSNEAILTATFDLDAVRAQRHAWGVFRDRRPELYAPLLTLDGTGEL